MWPKSANGTKSYVVKIRPLSLCDLKFSGPFPRDNYDYQFLVHISIFFSIQVVEYYIGYFVPYRICINFLVSVHTIDLILLSKYIDFQGIDIPAIMCLPSSLLMQPFLWENLPTTTQWSLCLRTWLVILLPPHFLFFKLFYWIPNNLLFPSAKILLFFTPQNLFLMNSSFATPSIIFFWMACESVSPVLVSPMISRF